VASTISDQGAGGVAGALWWGGQADVDCPNLAATSVTPVGNGAGSRVAAPSWSADLLRLLTELSGLLLGFLGVLLGFLGSLPGLLGTLHQIHTLTALFVDDVGLGVFRVHRALPPHCCARGESADPVSDRRSATADMGSLWNAPMIGGDYY
jgi:hypothetical protein